MQSGHVEVDGVAVVEEAADAAVTGHTRQPMVTHGIKKKRSSTEGLAHTLTGIEEPVDSRLHKMKPEGGKHDA